MTARDFIYWLQGYFELENPKEIDLIRISTIQKHIELVMKK